MTHRARWPDPIHARFLELRRKAAWRYQSNEQVRQAAREQVRAERARARSQR